MVFRYQTSHLTKVGLRKERQGIHTGQAPFHLAFLTLPCYEVSRTVVRMGRFAYAKRAKRRSSNAAIDAAKALRKAGKEMECVALLLWEELPQWQQDGNQSIETGYRYAASMLLLAFLTNALQTTCRWVVQDVLEELDVYSQRICQHILSSHWISTVCHVTIWHIQGACTTVCNCR